MGAIIPLYNLYGDLLWFGPMGAVGAAPLALLVSSFHLANATLYFSLSCG
jgi:hypothetical protein